MMDATSISHFGYGALCGALYGLGRKYFSGKRGSLNSVLVGSSFGLGIWGASYLGWIPAAGLRAAAKNQPSERVGMMILAHLIWGASLGYAEDQLYQYGQK